jgi:hypothetical protein
MNKLLLPLVIINYYVYRFYQRWETNPVGWTIRLVGLFIFLNFISLLLLLDKVSVLVPKGNYYILVLPLMAATIALNYFLIFQKDKYHSYFSIIQSRKSKHWHFIFFCFYFTVTVVPTVIMVSTHFASHH